MISNRNAGAWMVTSACVLCDDLVTSREMILSSLSADLQRLREFNKRLSYRRESALQGAL